MSLLPSLLSPTHCTDSKAPLPRRKEYSTAVVLTAARGVQCPAQRQSSWFPLGTRAPRAVGHCSPLGK